MSTLLSYLTIAVAHAQLPLPGAVESNKPGEYALAFVCNILFTWVFTAAIVFSIILALVAAYRYMSSAGDPAKVKTANNTLIFLAIGVAVAIFARSAPVIVGSFISEGVSLDPCAVTPKPPGT